MNNTQQLDTQILQAEWLTEEQWHKGLNDAPAPVSYGKSKSGAHEWQGRATKWHNKSFSAIEKRYSAQADAVEAGRDEDDNLFFAV